MRVEEEERGLQCFVVQLLPEVVAQGDVVEEDGGGHAGGAWKMKLNQSFFCLSQPAMVATTELLLRWHA